VERTWQLEPLLSPSSAAWLLVDLAGQAELKLSGHALTGARDTASTWRAWQQTYGNRAVQRAVAALRPVSAEADVPGQPLAPAVRETMQNQLGQDFGRVRLHADAQAHRLATRLGAEAVTIGRDIFFAPGQYDPTSYRGQRLLAHELAHVVQADQPSLSTAAPGLISQPGDRYEREADRIAGRIAPLISRPGSAWGASQDAASPRPGAVVRERWRGPGLLVARAAAATTPAPAAAETRLKAAGLSMAQALCIKLWYERTMAMAKSDRWKRCYLACKLATTCGLPPLPSMNLAALREALRAFIGPAPWDEILTEALGMAARVQAGRTCEECANPARG
jgi:hypothetical protein